MAARKSRTAKGAWRWGLATSVTLHLVLLSGVCLTALLIDLPIRSPLNNPIGGGLELSAEWTQTSQIKSADIASDLVVPRLDRIPEIRAELPELSGLIQSRMQQEIEKLDKVPAVEQRQRLESMANRLEAIATEGSVTAVGATLRNALNLPDRTSVMNEPAEVRGEFDPETAQIDDVVLVTVDGIDRYMATLVDSQGNSVDVELDAEEGRQLLDTFSLIKKFPLMRTVYRQVVMGLLDQMLTKSSDKKPDSSPGMPQSNPPEPVGTAVH